MSQRLARATEFHPPRLRDSTAPSLGMPPSVGLDRTEDFDGELSYRLRRTWVEPPLDADTAAALNHLMMYGRIVLRSERDGARSVSPSNIASDSRCAASVAVLVWARSEPGVPRRRSSLSSARSPSIANETRSR